jgi:hypothetical protein
MKDKREHTNHPYLEDREDDNRKNLVLWNTNAFFPVRNLIEAGPDSPAISERRAKVKKQPAITPKANQGQPNGGMDTLSPFAQWLMKLRPSSLHGHPDEFIDPVRAVTLGTIVKESDTEPGKQKKKKKKKKKKEARQKREVGHSELPILDTEIVSDTLAELIASQGHIEEAIAMYRKLVTHHPEKTAHYIQRISELRQGKT